MIYGVTAVVRFTVARIVLGKLLKIMVKEETDKVKAEGLRKASKVLTSLHDIGVLVTVVTGYLFAVRSQGTYSL